MVRRLSSCGGICAPAGAKRLAKRRRAQHNGVVSSPSSDSPPTRFEPRRARDELQSVYRSAYEEGRRLVDAQRAELDSMRLRTLAFLAFTGTATAFLVGTSLTSPSQSDLLFYGLAGSATLLWVGTLLLCLSVLLAPKPLKQMYRVRRSSSNREPYWWAMSWRFGMRPYSMVRVANPGQKKQPGTADVYQKLALDYESMWDHNKILLARVRFRYAWFLALACIQLSLWITLVWLVGNRGSGSG